MNRPETESFPAEVTRKLKTYVCRLIGPRHGETFYVGKGQANRGYSRIRSEQKPPSSERTTASSSTTGALRTITNRPWILVWFAKMISRARSLGISDIQIHVHG
jgi:hypothetical protein